MAVLETLRTKFGMAITILVALGLLSFIIDPSSLETAYHAMSSKYDVGEIDGKSISYNDFQAEVDHYKDISQLLSGSSAESTQQQAQIHALSCVPLALTAPARHQQRKARRQEAQQSRAGLIQKRGEAGAEQGEQVIEGEGRGRQQQRQEPG